MHRSAFSQRCLLLIFAKLRYRARDGALSFFFIKLQLLKLNKTSLGQTAVGQIVNLMSNDVARFDLTPVFLHYMWIMPIQAVAAALIMYNSVGWAALAGLAAITLQAVPLQGKVKSRLFFYFSSFCFYCRLLIEIARQNPFSNSRAHGSQSETNVGDNLRHSGD